MTSERPTSKEPLASAPADGAYEPPAILWEEEFVALAACSVNICDCPNPPPELCSGG